MATSSPTKGNLKGFETEEEMKANDLVEKEAEAKAEKDY